MIIGLQKSQKNQKLNTPGPSGLQNIGGHRRDITGRRNTFDKIQDMILIRRKGRRKSKRRRKIETSRLLVFESASDRFSGFLLSSAID